ncbi:MAG TPA: hypothetical protein VF920_02295 [Dongiaceae bacterium]
MAKPAGTTSIGETGHLPAGFAGLALPVRRIDVEQPWTWLRRGWNDFGQARGISLFFGAIIALVSAGLIYGLWQQDALPYVLPLAAGYMFMAPIMAAIAMSSSSVLVVVNSLRLNRLRSTGRSSAEIESAPRTLDTRSGKAMLSGTEVTA